MTVRLVPILAVCTVLNAQQRADIRVEVDLVAVACSVTDRGGSPAKNLRPEDFIVRDNGVPQKLKYLWQESELPLTIGLIVDVSGSQMGFVNQHRETVARFLSQVLGPKDRAFLVQIAQKVRLVTGLTNSIDQLGDGVRTIGTRAAKEAPLLGDPCKGHGILFGCGGTALWHGLYFAALLEKRPLTGRKALIVLTDGMDTGSDRSVSDVIEAAQGAETAVYTIKYASPARFISPALMLRSALSHGLERLAIETGGVPFSHPKDKTPQVFAQIESDLRNLYVLGFTPPDDARDGKFHKLDVKTARPDLVVRTRAGYYARGGGLTPPEPSR